MSDVGFIRDEGIDAMISDIIDIFMNVEGVNLVRLSGMTKRASRISGKGDMPPETVDSIIKKLKSAGVIQYMYIVNCPHCGERSYIVKEEEGFKEKPKMCDTCNTFFTLIEGSTIYTN